MPEKIKDIPANPNTLLNGWTDPTPEKGTSGRVWRIVVSGLKGIFTTN
jgi:hypothetical protein